RKMELSPRFQPPCSRGELDWLLESPFWPLSCTKAQPATPTRPAMTTRKTVLITVLCALATCPAFPKEHVAAVERAPETTSPLECFFLPPKGWEIADPKMLSPRVKISFVKNTGKEFRPSINLAVEPTQASPSEYLKAVRAIHEQDRTNHWRALGKVRTA